MAVVNGLVNLAATFTQVPPGADYMGAAIMALAEAFAVSNGTGSGAADKMYHDTITVAGGANASLDLQTALDVAGVALAAVECRFLAFKVTTTGTGVTIKAHAANGWAPSVFATDVSDILPTKGGGVYIFSTPTNGSPAIDGTHKVVYFLNTDGALTADVEVWFVGCSA